jgi:transcriptional regulator with XRE-family HTH domain
VKNGAILVTPAEAKALGALLRDQRKKLGLSTHQLGAQTGMRQSTITRVEQGMFASPRPDKLARMAEVLGLSLADLFARAGYLVPDDLPSFHVYLPAKYRELPRSAIDELVAQFEVLLAEHAVPAAEPVATAEGADG